MKRRDSYQLHKEVSITIIFSSPFCRSHHRMWTDHVDHRQTNENSRKVLDLRSRNGSYCRSHNRISLGDLDKTHESIARHIDHRRTNQKGRKHSDLNVMSKMAASRSYDLVTQL